MGFIVKVSTYKSAFGKTKLGVVQELFPLVRIYSYVGTYSVKGYRFLHVLIYSYSTKGN